jgi:hypothetical protein
MGCIRPKVCPNVSVDGYNVSGWIQQLKQKWECGPYFEPKTALQSLKKKKNQEPREVEVGELWSKVSLGKSVRPYLKTTYKQKGWRYSSLVGHLPSKHKAMISILSTGGKGVNTFYFLHGRKRLSEDTL